MGVIDSVEVEKAKQDSMAIAGTHENAGDRSERANSSGESGNVNISSKDYDPNFMSEDSLVMEKVYSEMLKPIASLKSTDPKIYWFIVSWLNTKYKTPNWDNYDSADWRMNTKKRGIDCSGFSRVMEDQVFGKKIYGGSQGILDKYCTPVDKASLTMGDLVFFRAPYSETDKIVHVGVYLMDDLFVHATSEKSAAKGKGLNINSLNEENWAKELVTGGKIK